MNRAIVLSCQWISRLAQLFGLWLLLSLRGGLVLGIFPAYVALHPVARGWLAGRTVRPYQVALAEYRAEWVRANRVGYLIAGTAAAMLGGAVLVGQTDDLSSALRLLWIIGGGLLAMSLPITLSFVASVSCGVVETLLSTWRFYCLRPLHAIAIASMVVAVTLLGLFNLLAAVLLGFGALVVFSELVIHKTLVGAQSRTLETSHV